MNTNSFKSTVLDPLVKGFFSKIRRYNDLDTSEFYENHKNYCIEFIKRWRIDLDNENSDIKELQKEFVYLFFSENPEYDYFKFELDLSMDKTKSKKNISNVGDSIRIAKNDINKYNQLIGFKIRNELSQFTITLEHNKNRKLNIKLNDPEIAGLIIESYYSLINFFYGSMSSNQFPGEPTKITYIDDGSLLHITKKTTISERKKEIVQAFVEYFNIEASNKVLKFFPIHERLGWACSKEKYNEIEKKSKKREKRRGIDFEDYQYTYIDDIHRKARNSTKNKKQKIPS